MKFYKIFHAKVTPKTRLSIPNKFVERYGAAVPTTVMLQLPTGEQWRVEVEKREDEMWLGNGLFEFAESLGINCGDFLMFYYDVNHSMFHMVVVQTSAAEIEYPPFHCSAEKQKDKQSGPKVNEQNEEYYNYGRSRGIKAQYPFCESSPRKAKASSSLSHEAERMNMKSSDDEFTADGTTVIRGRYGNETILGSDGRLWGIVQGSVTYYNNAKTEKALKRARELIAEEPFCIIILSHSCVRQGRQEYTAKGLTEKKSQLPFPRSFIKEYFNLEKRNVTLRTNDGRTWSVNYSLPQQDKHGSFFIRGWKQFAIDNDLQAGEVCKFEMTKGAENALKVVIFRDSDGEASL